MTTVKVDLEMLSQPRVLWTSTINQRMTLHLVCGRFELTCMGYCGEVIGRRFGPSRMMVETSISCISLAILLLEHHAVGC